MKLRIGVAITISIVVTLAYFALSIRQAIKDFHDEPDGFWE